MKILLITNCIGPKKNHTSGPGIVSFNFYKSLKKYSKYEFLFLFNEYSYFKQNKNIQRLIYKEHINKNFLNNFDIIHILSNKKLALDVAKFNHADIIGTNVVFDINNVDNLTSKQKIQYKDIIYIEQQISNIPWKKVLVPQLGMIEPFDKKFKNVKKENIIDFPCGIDTEYFTGNNDINKKIILWVGPGEKKGYDLFLKIQNRLKHKYYFICKNNSYDYLTHIKDLRKANLYLSLSRYETQGLATMEAMSCGLPVVCAEFTSSLSPIFENNVMMSKRNVNDIVKNIEKILSDQNLYNLYRKKSLDFIKNYTLEKMNQKYENIIESLK